LTIPDLDLIIEGMRETVLYYAPEDKAYASVMRGVLAQMGIRVKNLTPERCVQRIGFLAGMEGCEKREVAAGYEKYAPVMGQELLIFCGLTEERLDEVLESLKNAGVPKIDLKAVVTPTNAEWTVYQLYEQLLSEHGRMK
jgi:hypothetical protein